MGIIIITATIIIIIIHMANLNNHSSRFHLHNLLHVNLVLQLAFMDRGESHNVDITTNLIQIGNHLGHAKSNPHANNLIITIMVLTDLNISKLRSNLNHARNLANYGENHHSDILNAANKTRYRQIPV